MRIFLLFFLIFQWLSLRAQEPDTSFISTDTVIHTFDNVVVKASRHEVLVKNFPGSVQVLRKESIQAAGLSGMANILNQAAGVNMQSGGFQTSRITIRGVGSRNPYGSGRIRAFFEDIPLSAGDGTTIVEDLEPFFIEKAEITKGPNSAWYGSGLGGSIRFSGPVAQTDTLRLFSQAGSYGYWKAGGLATLLYPAAGINAGFSHTEGVGHRENSRFFKRSFLLSGSLGENHRMNYLFLFNDVKSHIPSSVDENTYINHPEKAAANWNRVQGYRKYQRFLGGIRLLSKAADNVTNALSVSGSYNNPYELRPFNILDDVSMSFQIQDQVLIQWNHHLLLGGFEYLQENYQWQILNNNDLSQQQESKELRYQWNAFLSWEWKIADKLNFSAGMNLNQTRYELHDLFSNDSMDYSGKTKRKPVLSPRLGVNYSVNHNLSIYASFGHGFSNPTVEESLNSQGYINPDLKPEEGWGFDAGVRAYLLKRSIWFDFVYYRIRLQELLVTHRISEEIFSGANAGSASLHGVELMTNYYVSRNLQLRFTYQQSLNRFEKYIQDAEDFSKKNLPGIPSFYFRTDLQYRIFKNFETGINHTVTGKQYLTDSNSLQVPSWQILDARMLYKMNFRKWYFFLQAGVRNITREHYPSMVLINAPSPGGNAPRYYYPGLPRNFYFAIEVSF